MYNKPVELTSFYLLFIVLNVCCSLVIVVSLNKPEFKLYWLIQGDCKALYVCILGLMRVCLPFQALKDILCSSLSKILITEIYWNLWKSYWICLIKKWENYVGEVSFPITGKVKLVFFLAHLSPHSSGHIFAPIIIKLCQDAYLGNSSDEFEHGSSQMIN
jgi:hypothetical protein